MSPWQYVCNGLASPADESVLAGDRQRDMIKT